MDIGSLTGRIELEDKLTEGLSLAMGQVKKFAEEFTSAMGVTSLVVGAAVSAIGLISGAIVGLGEKGSTLLGVEAAFDHLAESTGTTVGALNDAGKLEGKRIAILDATRAYVERLGVSELSFKERITQGRVA